MTTRIPSAVEKFTTTTKKCTCCQTKQHLYMFPLDKKTQTRGAKCNSCIQEKCLVKKCRLGELRD